MKHKHNRTTHENKTTKRTGQQQQQQVTKST